MYYKALYTEDIAVDAAKTAMLNLIKMDEYYPMYDSRFGTGIVFRYFTDGGWEDNLFCNGNNVANMGIEDLPETVSWTSCAGNCISYKLIGDGVLVEINSRRHGIPCHAMKNFSPTTVWEYKSQQDHWGPYETLQNHPEDKPLSPEAYWADQFTLPLHQRMGV